MNTISSESIDPNQDWSFCVESLEGVSRTFSRPIALLDPPLRETVATSYLLCRVVDTIEDDPGLTLSARAELYRAFLASLHGESSGEWAQRVRALTGTPAEVTLAHGIDRVLRVLNRAPPEMQRVARQWVAEMCRGMEIFSHRPTGVDDIRALIDLSDLHRYCYFVAGTVGHLLTELFLLHGQSLVNERARREMRRHAEAFGVGLQLVNILKDIAQDRQRGWSFIPRVVVTAVDFDVLFDRTLRSESHRSIAPVFAKAYACLDDALEYVLAVPPALRSVRLFVLIPLWLAVETLNLAEGNDDIFDASARVAISRAEVEALIASCQTQCEDDAALRRDYQRMRGRRSSAA